MANVLDAIVDARALRDRQTTARFVADTLRDAIQSGKLVDGTELNQVQLAEHFGVSRVPVREALRALEAEGWISALPHRRALVLAQTPERVHEIFDMRSLLEAHLVAKAALGLNDGRIAQLLQLCDEMDAGGDHMAWIQKNREFHRVLLESANSPMTLSMLEQLNSQVERYMRRRADTLDRAAEAGIEHRAIVAAVQARDAVGAAELVRTHVEHTRRRVIAEITPNVS